ncbi:hypothetical protein Fmac_007731 [Flemingia macrophylla]|uniref:PGG domain-containing protein n=1 Tax=Flemingia macrophylla TaxID=520843 RepID=A0ABD1MVD4_9FABA
MAAGSRVVEIIEKIIDKYPEANCHNRVDEHNILHMAVKHRQLKIFNMLKKHSAFKSLIFRITAEGRALLHQISRMEFYVEQRFPGVAFQLEDALRWYERANSRGCFGTIPGGTNQKNSTPMFLGSGVFLFFTIKDVVALVSSLASVVMFLSILTSPFELWDFRRSLPRKLGLGFAFLFFSLACTTLTFSATVLLTIRLQNHQKWASFLFFCAVLFPVAIFWRMQFPLYKMLQRLAKTLLKTLKQAVPTTFINYSRKRARRKKNYPMFID